MVRSFFRFFYEVLKANDVFTNFVEIFHEKVATPVYHFGEVSLCMGFGIGFSNSSEKPLIGNDQDLFVKQ